MFDRMPNALPQRGQAWRHYKGGVYTIAGLAFEEATGNILVVYYRPTYHPDGLMFTRPLGEFMGVTSDRKLRFERSEAHDGLGLLERMGAELAEISRDLADFPLGGPPAEQNQAIACIKSRVDFAAAEITRV